MKEFYLAVLSGFRHQEGYLNLALADLIESGKASDGVNADGNHFITILYDKNENRYLLFKAKDLEKVKDELHRRVIKAEGALEINSEKQLENVFNDNIHRDIQRGYASQNLHSPILN